MEIKRRHWVLFVLFLTFFITRSLIAAQQDNFGNDTSYYTMRQIEHFSKNWRPLHYDTLSYGGRNFIVMPFYYYLMGFFYKVFPNILFLKILNNFFASTIIFGVYFLSVKILKNTKIALFCSVVASSIPIYLSETMNNLNPYSIVTPLAFFIIALFLELNEKVLNYLIPLTIIFILSSFDSLILVIGIISYIIYVF
jgi:4-amino-4-deoxy-L-arabinose transferase-like glycosyltransferase